MDQFPVFYFLLKMPIYHHLYMVDCQKKKNNKIKAFNYLFEKG